MTAVISGLFAYPSEPPEIGLTICSCIKKLSEQKRFRQLSSWEENDIAGRFIATEALKRIEGGSCFVADITRLNFNVVFEIGYAIGCEKRAFLVRNEAIRPDDALIRQVGIFDTLGYDSYNDSKGLISLISGIDDLASLRFDKNAASSTTPVYVVLPRIKGDAETRLIARIKKGGLFFRSFDPEEHGRLSAREAIENVASSHGVVIPLLPSHFTDAKAHNFRAAFVAGLTQGMGRVLLLLQSGDDPVPLDYRDLVRSFKFPDEIDEHIAEFAPSVTESMQSSQPAVVTDASTFLASLTLGASSAENEFQELGNYYLETDEFRRALRGEVQIVLGRKGTGKTALFFQLRNRLRRDTRIVVLDLKPEGFQLLKFKELVLDYLEEGTREHTVTAFWEYLLLLEICHKLLQKDRGLHLRNHKLYSPYRSLASTYDNDAYVSEGDFAERMLKLTQRIAEDFGATRAELRNGQRMSGEEITQLVYKHDIGSLRSQLFAYLQHKQGVWILFDNLDKGWPPHGVGSDDVLSLRCLLDAMGKLQRASQRKGVSTTGIVFIRNDVYEHLVAATPDRGKISHALVDWTDPSLLLEMLRRRFLSLGVQGAPPFENLWQAVCVSHIQGEETSHYMVERCLMRPRSLIEFLSFCRGHAVNLGHQKILAEDIEEGEERYSTQLVNDICYEIQDVFPPGKDLLYEFIECPAELDRASLQSILDSITDDDTLQEKALDLLLWYGVIGFRRSDGRPAFIYSVRYDMKRFKALLKNVPADDNIFLINPAFWKGLEIRRLAS